MQEQKIKNILNEIIGFLNPRVREVIEKRFGLRAVSHQTLEAIGKNMGITRERVRQIEALGLRQLSNKNIVEPLKPILDTIEQYLKGYSGVKKEDCFLKETADLFSLKEKNRENIINFLLVLGKGRFSYFKETPTWHAAWALDAAAYNETTTLVDALKKRLAEEKTPIPRSEISKIAGFSHVELSRHISQNPFGEWGLVNSPEVSPKGVKDKAYLVFKKENRPLHFAQVAELINRVVFSDRKAHPQTVHNELIKDPRFVLVGRGTYALSDWGYEPGTVRDVLVSILKNAGKGMTKEEIIKNVQAKRLVKENTIILNLQNKKVFKKTDNERFTLA